MLYLSYSQTATSVSEAVKGDFLKPGVVSLVQAKSNHIEVHSLEANGLRLAIDVPLYGTVLKIAAVRLRNVTTAALAVLTTNFVLFVITFEDGKARTLATHNVAERGAVRSSELVTMISSDKDGEITQEPTEYLVIHAFAGLLRVVILDDTKLDTKKKTGKAGVKSDVLDLSAGFTVRIQELILNSIIVLPPRQAGQKHRLAIIHTDHSGQRVFQLHNINFSGRTIEPESSEDSVSYLAQSGLVLSDPDSQLMIPLRIDTLEGLILVGQDSARFVHTSHIAPIAVEKTASSLTGADVVEEPEDATAAPTVSSSKGKGRMREPSISEARSPPGVSGMLASSPPTSSNVAKPRRRSSAAASALATSPQSSSALPNMGLGKRKLSESAQSSGRGKASVRERMASRIIECNLPVSQYLAYCRLEDDPTRILLVDAWGHLLYLTVSNGQKEASSTHSISASSPISPGGTSSSLRARRSSRSGSISGSGYPSVKLSFGNLRDVRVSAPTSLVALGSGYLFVASHYGDSLLVRLTSNAASGNTEQTADSMDVDQAQDGPASPLEIVSTYPNLAPIVDLCVVKDGQDAGPSHVITCSGGRDDGSLRIVRHGVGLSELANIDVAGVQRAWAIASKHSGQTQDVLVLSFVNETRLISLAQNDEVEEIDELGAFDLSSPTLLAHTTSLGPIQVTSAGIRSISSSWSPPDGQKITLAAALNDTLLVAAANGTLYMLAVEATSLTALSTHQLAHEAASIDIAELQHDGRSFTIATVGLWTSQEILTFSVPDLSVTGSLKIDSAFLPKSVISSPIAADGDDPQCYLLVGLGDGTLQTYNYGLGSDDRLQPLAGTRKVLSLGSRPVELSRVMTGGNAEDGVEPQQTIFITGSRCAIVSAERGKLAFSNVNMREVSNAVALQHATYRNAIVLMTPSGLRISRIDSLQKLHIQTIRLGNQAPRRIAHSRASKALGVIFLQERLNRSTGDIARSSSFKVLDETTFEVLADFDLHRDEEARSVAAIRLWTGEEAFVVGTGYILSDQAEAKNGRVLLYQAASDGSYSLAAEFATQGAVHAVTQLEKGRFAVACNNEVIALNLSPRGDIEAVATWSSSFICYGLSSRGNTLIAVDPLRSASLLQFNQKTSKITDIARDFSAYGVFAAAFLKTADVSNDTASPSKTLAGDEIEQDIYREEVDQSIIIADLDENLFTSVPVSPSSTNSSSLNSHKVMSTQARVHVGEIVNKFVHGSLVNSSNTEIAKRSAAPTSMPLLFGTSVGSIGSIIGIESAEEGQLLSDIERNLRRTVDRDALGGMHHQAYRSFKSEYRNEASAGFIDGGLVEQLLEMSDEQVQQTLAGNNEHEIISERQRVFDIVEELQRTH